MPTIHSCPIPACDWTHTDDGPDLVDHPLSPADAVALTEAHASVVAAELGAHFETHPAHDWVLLVHQLRKELGKRPAPLLCAGCISERHDAQVAGVTPLPQINQAQVIVGGNGSCLGHVQFGPAALPGRTPGGLIV